MADHFHLPLLPFLCLLAACNVTEADDAATKNGARAASGEDTVQGSPQARAYMARFIENDPDECFDGAVLKQAKFVATSETAQRPPPVRVVIAVDGSGSMAGRIGSRTKLELGREAALGFVDGLPLSVEVALLVFGQQGNNTDAGKALSCKGIDLLSPMATDRAPLREGVRRLRAVGWTPLAAGLERAETLLEDTASEGEQIIYVVSDGKETCGGDAVAMARRINEGETKAIINIIGFDLPSAEAAALEAVADAGQGEFVNVDGESAFDRTMAEVREANRRAVNAGRRSDAIAGNAVRTAEAAGKAAVCVSEIISGEAVRMSNDLSRLAQNGQEKPYHKEALELLDQRHDKLKSREDHYRARLKSAEDAARAKIDEADEATQ